MQLKIVPIGELDLEQLQFLAATSSEEKAVEAIARGVDELTPAQRKASKWPSPDQLRQAVRATGKAKGFEVWDGGGKTTFDMSLSLYKDAAKKKLAKSLTVSLHGRKAYYCTGSEDVLCALAGEVAKVAGPQVSFAAEDVLLESCTKLHVAGITARPPARKKR